MARIRVLHVLQSLNYGGMERLVAEMVRSADHSTFDLHVMGLQYLGHFSEGLEGLATLHTGPAMSRASLVRPAALARAIREIAPDVVHSHSGVWLKAGRAARMAGVPLVVHTEHGRRSPDPWSDRLLDGLGARHSDRVVAVSGLLAEQLERNLRIPHDRISVILNGIDTDAVLTASSDVLRRELGIAADIPILGSVGRLEFIKAYDVAIEAMARLETPGVMVVGGDGAERVRLERMVRDRGLQDRVYLLGWRNDVHPILAASTLFTMSSRSEGTSVSLLEAMSAGLCPVVTKVGGNPVVLGEALAHRLVPSEDPAALAAQWQDALQNADRREADGKQARARVESKFSLQVMVSAYENIYRTVKRQTPERVSAGGRE